MLAHWLLLLLAKRKNIYKDLSNPQINIIFVTLILNPKYMKTSNSTALSSYNDIHSKRLKTIIMKEEKEYIEKQDKIQELREAIFEGLESGIAENFDPKSHLEALKREYKNV